MEIKQTIDKEYNEKMSSFRWVICGLLFLATTVNYMDRQVLSLTWKDFISPEFHWTDADYGVITAIFSIVYAVANLFAGRFIDWMGTKKGYLWAIGVWSAGACLHALCGWATEHTVGLHDAAEMVSATGTVASLVAITSVYYFIAARVVLAVGESGNFPAAGVNPAAGPFLSEHGCRQRLGDGLYRNRRSGLRVDGSVDVLL